MINAIVYESCTGFTKQYAEMMAKGFGLGVFSLKEAESAVERNSEIIFLGWLNAGKVMGLKQVQQNYQVRAVCGVGMAKTGAQIMDIRKRNSFADGTEVFTLQGGFDMDRLPGKYRFMMKVMRSTYGKKLAAKQNRTPEEDDMLDMLMHGGSRVSETNLEDICEWYEKQK